MHFLIDEDLPRSIASVLRKYNHAVTDVRDIGLRGSTDAEIAAHARRHGLCLLSGDMGFADIRNYPPEQYAGIIVLHLPSGATSPIILSLLDSLLTRTDIVTDLNGKLAIVERGRVRIRKGT